MISFTKIQKWVKNANGWQRIWLVFVAIVLIYYGVIFPINESGQGSYYRNATDTEISKEIRSMQCDSFMSKPFYELVEPEPASNEKITCINIFHWRKYELDQKPFTEKSYNSQRQKDDFVRITTFLSIGWGIAIFLSAFSYAIGVVVAWVIKGFQSKS